MDKDKTLARFYVFSPPFLEAFSTSPNDLQDNFSDGWSWKFFLKKNEKIKILLSHEMCWVASNNWLKIKERKSSIQIDSWSSKRTFLDKRCVMGFHFPITWNMTQFLKPFQISFCVFNNYSNKKELFYNNDGKIYCL